MFPCDLMAIPNAYISYSVTKINHSDTVSLHVSSQRSRCIVREQTFSTRLVSSIPAALSSACHPLAVHAIISICEGIMPYVSSWSKGCGQLLNSRCQMGKPYGIIITTTTNDFSFEFSTDCGVMQGSLENPLCYESIRQVAHWPTH